MMMYFTMYMCIIEDCYVIKLSDMIKREQNIGNFLSFSHCLSIVELQPSSSMYTYCVVWFCLFITVVV